MEAGLRQQGAIERVIVVAEKHLRATVAALGDMVRQAGNDEAGKAARAPSSAEDQPMSISALSPEFGFESRRPHH